MDELKQIENIQVKICNSITELPPGVWNKYISEDHPAKTEAFLKVIEESGYNTEKFYYMLLYKNKSVIGCVMFTLNSIDGCLFLPNKITNIINKIRKLYPGFLKVKTLQTGSMLTQGRHWWFDSNEISWTSFIEVIQSHIDQISSNYTFQVFRDFIFHSDDLLTEEEKSILCRWGFVEVNSLPLAEISIPEGCNSEEYLLTLTSKKRCLIRRIGRKLRRNGFEVGAQALTPDLVDKIYPLYVNVSLRAKEIKTPTLPLSFFRAVSESKEVNANVITICDEDQNIMAFALNFENQKYSAPYFMGLDYRLNKELNLYYNLSWEVISYSVSQNKGFVDMGLTTYNVKRGMGAKLLKIIMFIRFRNKIFNRIFSRLLPMVFGYHHDENYS